MASVCSYTQNMQTDHAKVAVTTAWVLAVGAAGFLVGTTSFAVWAGLATLALVPPAVMMRLWTAPAPSTSESIREALR
jgi:hypothetical protein